MPTARFTGASMLLRFVPAMGAEATAVRINGSPATFSQGPGGPLTVASPTVSASSVIEVDFLDLFTYIAVRDAAIDAAVRNSASLWFPGYLGDLAGALFQDAGATTYAGPGDPAGFLKDRSGLGRHATQAAVGSRPILQRGDTGFYSVVFDGANDFLQHQLALGMGAPGTLIAAFKNTAGLASATIATAGAPTTASTQRVLQARIASGELQVYDVTDAGAAAAYASTWAFNAPHVAEVVSLGASFDTYLDGTLLGNTVAPVGTTTVPIGTIGAKDGTGAEAFGGPIWLVCQSLNVMPSADRAAIRRFGALLSGATVI